MWVSCPKLCDLRLQYHLRWQPVLGVWVPGACGYYVQGDVTSDISVISGDMACFRCFSLVHMWMLWPSLCDLWHHKWCCRCSGLVCGWMLCPRLRNWSWQRRRRWKTRWRRSSSTAATSSLTGTPLLDGHMPTLTVVRRNSGGSCLHQSLYFSTFLNDLTHYQSGRMIWNDNDLKNTLYCKSSRCALCIFGCIVYCGILPKV